MKKIYLLFISIVMASIVNAQVTVTNPANTTPGLASTYTTLALAIADLNLQTAISGPVIITLNAGNPQTCPSGGYSITAILAGASATNKVTIDGSSNTVTAPVPAGTVGNLNDAIFKFIGSDFMTLQNFVMNENGANVVTTAASNDMVEWGVALLYATSTNGAQNITIQNNTIALNRTYQNTFGIYSNSTHTATTVTTSATATTTAGGNSGLKIYSNNISNVNNGIIVVGPTAAADMNTGIDIGGASAATANTLSNFGTTGTFSGYANVSGTVNGILVRNSTGLNVSYNSITSSVGGVTAGSLNGIQLPAFSNTPTGTFTQTINNNSISLRSGVAAGAMNGINIAGIAANLTSTININNNDFNNFGHTVAASGAITFIVSGSGAQALTTNINSNTFTNMTVNTTGSVTFINTSGAMAAGSSENVVSNSIVTQFNKTGAGGTVAAYVNSATGVTGSTMTHNLNNFSNITVTGATAITLWSNSGGTAASGTTKNITNNTFANITGGLSQTVAISINGGGNGTSVSNNTISNVSIVVPTTVVVFAGILIGTSNGGAVQTYANNKISGLSAGGAAGAQLIGIQGGSTSITTLNVNNNTISACTNTNVAGNTNAGMSISNTGATTNIFKNKIYDISNTGGGVSSGMHINSPTATNVVNVYNNYIGKIYSTSSTFYQAVRGIGLLSTVAATMNLYYNTVYLDGTTTGQSYCVYIGNGIVNVPNVNTQNNIFVNNISSSNGATLPQTVYFRLGATTAGNLLATTNNNLLYCGTPSADHLMYFDGAVSAITNPIQTLAAYQTFVSPRETVSKTELPPFINTTIPANASYLHINPTIATQAESGAVNVATYTDDYDTEIRQGNVGYPGTSTGTAPDIGADEFDATIDLFGPEISYTALNSVVCTSNRTFTATITDYSGVNITTGTLPRVYYKKSTNANSLGGTNTNTTDGWKWVEGTFSGGSAFSFTIDYSLVFGGVSAGENIQYFVTAQDLKATPNVGINSGVFAATPATVALSGAAFPLTGTINSYSIVLPLPTAITIGVGQTYTTLTGPGGLFADLNTKGLAGNTTVNIIDASVTETGANSLNQMVYDCAGPYTLTIKPNASGTTLTGSLANGALLKIKSSNVIIDGSSNGTTSRDLTITNTSTTGPQVVLIGSTGTVAITNTMVKNSIMINGINTSSAIVVSDGTNAGSSGYFNNITLQNNNIQKAYMGMYCNAVATAGNGSGFSISNNSINTSGANAVRYTGIYVQGVDGVTISGNDIGNFETTTAESDQGIWLATGTGNAVIEKNNIHDIKYTGTSGYGARGITISSGLAAANITVRNNMIYGITGDGDSYATNGAFYCPVGIYAFGAGQGGINIYYNSIYLSGNTLNFSANAYSIGIALDNNTTATIKDNIVKNELGLLSSIGVGAVGIAAQTAASQFIALDYNDYYSNASLGSNLIGKIGGTDYATLAAWQTATGQEANSLNVNPNFTSTTDLHLAPGINCRLDGYGTPIAGITTDYDANTRDAGAPDMGADEFTTAPVPSSMATASNCDTKNVSPLGTLYLDGSCNLIAKVLPSGGNAVAGKIKTCVTIDGTQQYFNGQPYVQRHYDIEPTITDQTTTSATVTLYFTDAEFTAYNTNNLAWPPLPTLAGGGNIDPNRANVKVTQFHGVGSTNPTSPGNYPGVRVLILPSLANVFWNGSYWEISFNVAGFSGFYVHTNNFNSPLPIIVNYLTGRRQGNNHLLNWKVTCASTPRATMTLERSSDGRTYTGINTITADAARCNSPFDYTDANPLKGMNYYRLKIVDADGHVTYSTTVALLNAIKGFDIISIAPNPVVNNNFNLNVTSAQSAKMEIGIFDMQGRLVNRQTLSLIAGYNSMPVNVANLAPGTYTIKGNVDDDQSKVIRFVKQ